MLILVIVLKDVLRTIFDVLVLVLESQVLVLVLVLVLILAVDPCQVFFARFFSDLQHAID
jgi:hypothetical protein